MRQITGNTLAKRTWLYRQDYYPTVRKQTCKNILMGVERHQLEEKGTIK